MGLMPGMLGSSFILKSRTVRVMVMRGCNRLRHGGGVVSVRWGRGQCEVEAK